MDTYIECVENCDFYSIYEFVIVSLSFPTLLQLICTNPLHNDSTRRATSVTYRCSTILPNLKLVQQRDQYPTTRATQCVAQRNSSSTGVDVVRAQAENLGVGFDDGGEGFVELPDGNVFFL